MYRPDLVYNIELDPFKPVQAKTSKQIRDKLTKMLYS